MSSKLPPPGQLLSREDFDRYVRLRSEGLCVMCSEPGVDAHHIIERKLFPDGGYYLGNGALLCSLCHLNAELTTVSVHEVRSHAGITLPWILPPSFFQDIDYDKWGNVELHDGEGGRLAGPLIDDDGCRKALRLGGFLYKVKPRDIC